MNAPTETEYDCQVQQLQEMVPAGIMDYLTTIWLQYRDRFVSAWLRGVLHFGHMATSREKSAHAALKKWIAISTGDPLSVDTAIKLACEGQLTVIIQQLARERAVADANPGSMFATCTGKISLAGLQGAHKQYRMRNLSTTCYGLTKSTMGNPCAHDFLLRGKRPLSVDDFNHHWWLHVPVEPTANPSDISLEVAITRHQFALPYLSMIFNNKLTLAITRYREEYANEPSAARKRLMIDHLIDGQTFIPLENPTHTQGRGRPSGSTRRQPSAFEYVEAAAAINTQQPLQRRCRMPGSRT